MINIFEALLNKFYICNIYVILEKYDMKMSILVKYLNVSLQD